MKLSLILLPVAAVSLYPAVANAEQDQAPVAPASAETPSNAYIPFANHGGVWDWRSEGDDVVYFKDSHKQWYKAELFSQAHDLPFVWFIGIDAGPTDRLDRWGAIYVNGQRYLFKSFVKVDGPPVKAKKSKD